MPQLSPVGLIGRLGGSGGGGEPSPAWSPTDLGATLLGWFLAEDLTPGAVASWVDRVGAYDFTGAGAEQPTASATSYNGAPGVTFDGVANCLTLASVPFPTGASACNIWAVADQTALAADATARIIFGYGGDANTGQRRLYRSVTSGQNRPFGLVGTGGAAPTANLAADFSGRHYVRTNISGSSVAAGMDGTMSSGTAAVPATGTSRCRIGAVPNVAASSFFQGVIREIAITAAMTAQQVTDMNAYMAGRV